MTIEAEHVIPQSTGPVAVPSAREEAVSKRTWVPGEAGIWALLLTDLGIFTTYFIVFMFEWDENPEAWAEGLSSISLSAGILNTFFLLSASFFVALGVQTMRLGLVSRTRQLFVAAWIAGLLFAINKYVEWKDKIDAGHDPNDSPFLQMYFVITGIHLVHVLIAMTLLYFMWRKAGEVVGAPRPHQSRFIENCASYWHMVDLLWLGILALFYLIGFSA